MTRKKRQSLLLGSVSGPGSRRESSHLGAVLLLASRGSKPLGLCGQWPIPRGWGQQEPGVRLWPWLPLGQTLWTLWSNPDAARRAVRVLGLYTGVQKGMGAQVCVGCTVHPPLAPQLPPPPQSCSGHSSLALLKP